MRRRTSRSGRPRSHRRDTLSAATGSKGRGSALARPQLPGDPRCVHERPAEPVENL